ncbi:hypothetical protein ACFL2O_08550, partial [Thermodesulfobacteriota bacterium]
LVPIIVDGETILVPPAGLGYEGRIQPPVIIKFEGLDRKKMSVTTALGIDIVGATERTPKVGLTHWIEREQR